MKELTVLVGAIRARLASIPGGEDAVLHTLLDQLDAEIEERKEDN